MPDRKLVLERFGSNIIFSNGLGDPFSNGGVLENISDSIVAVNTVEGAYRNGKSFRLSYYNVIKAVPESLQGHNMAAKTICNIVKMGAFLFVVFGDGASLFKLIKHCRLSLNFLEAKLLPFPSPTLQNPTQGSQRTAKERSQ
ncbi:hypothetical protein NC651_033162 [Populus alba x Populus x berolinensis]|nr:hypothetical protein NC651_033162 [Populus alba x Populus x berolinensis]